MKNHNLIKDIELNHQSDNILVFNNIDSKLINQVMDNFKEYDCLSEVPLLFIQAGPKEEYKSYWIMISNMRIYYYLLYYPKIIDVLNCLSFDKIDSFDIKYNRWVKDAYIEINGKKIGSVFNLNKSELELIKDLANKIINHNEPITHGNSMDNDQEIDFESEGLLHIAANYFREENLGGKLWSFKCFTYGPFIPKEKLDIAKAEYANYDSEKEKPLIFYDNSWTGNLGKVDTSGFVITNLFMYYKLKTALKDTKFKKGKIRLTDINDFRILSRFWGWIIINRGRMRFKLTRFMFLDRYEARVLEKFMRLIIDFT